MSQSDGLMAFAGDNPALLLLIAGALFSFCVKLHRDNQRLKKEAIDITTSTIQKELTALKQTFEQGVGALTNALDKLSQEVFPRLNKLEREQRAHRELCDAMGDLCPIRNGKGLPCGGHGCLKEVS